MPRLFTRHSAMLLCLATLATFPARAENNYESASQASGCTGPQHGLPLNAVPGGSIDLPGTASIFYFGSQLEICATEKWIEIRGLQIQRYSCADLINENEGKGHDFIDRDAAYSLWFHVNPDRSPPVLEIGLYRDGDQLYWLDTGLPVCTG